MNLPRKKKSSTGLLLAMRPWTYWQILEQTTQLLGPAPVSGD